MGKQRRQSRHPSPGSEGQSVAERAVSDRGTGASEEDGERCSYSSECVSAQHGQAKKLWKPQKKWARWKSGLCSWKYSRKYYWDCVPQRSDDVGRPSPASSTFLML